MNLSLKNCLITLISSHLTKYNILHYLFYQTELERVIHKKIENHEQTRLEINHFINTHPSIKVLLKQGEFGSTIYYYDEEKKEVESLHKPAYDFKDFQDLKLVDTTGAGDCFTGAFAVKLLEGATYEECLTFGN